MNIFIVNFIASSALSKLSCKAEMDNAWSSLYSVSMEIKDVAVIRSLEALRHDLPKIRLSNTMN